MTSEKRLRNLLYKIAQDQGYEDHHVEVKKVSTVGANYTSELFFAVLSAPGKPNLKLFGKSSVLEAEIREMAGFDVFKTEILFFSKIVPKYKQLEETYNVPVDGRLVLPKFYGGSNDYSNEVLVFENLTEQGFQNFDRFICFDWDYASKCVEQLAILNALSIAFAEKEPAEYKNMTKDFKSGLSFQNLEQFLDRLIKESLNVTNEENKDKLAKFMKKMTTAEALTQFTKPERTPCLIHGDFRPSNILHRMDKDGKLQVVILDHQLTQQGNPLFDLFYFIFSGSDAIFRAKYFHKLLDHYYEHLSKSLIRLDVCPEKVYSKQDFEADVKLFLPFGLMIAVLLLPIITVKESKIPSTNDLVEGIEGSWESSHHLKQRLNDIVTDFVNMGVI